MPNGRRARSRDPLGLVESSRELGASALDLHRGSEAAPRCVCHNKVKRPLIRLPVCEGREGEKVRTALGNWKAR